MTQQELLKFIYQQFKCKECDGSGIHQTPSMYDPCSNCNGNGFDPDITLKDTFLDVKKVVETHE